MTKQNQPTSGPSRREFLGTTAAAAAALTASQLRADEGGAPEKTRRPMKKANMFGMLQMEGSLAEKFSALKGCGFDGVELNAPGQHKADEVREACKASGLE